MEFLTNSLSVFFPLNAYDIVNSRKTQTHLLSIVCDSHGGISLLS